MGHNEKKAEIIRRTAEMLSASAARVTTRGIADNAGINPAMVNYYFGSKANLLREAVSAMGEGRPTDVSGGESSPRKAMFDRLVRMCETNMRYARLGMEIDIVSFSGEILKESLALIEMKGHYGAEGPDKDDAVAVFKTVCFLMAASLDPEGLAECTGIDIRTKSGLRTLVSGQLDAMLGEAL